MSYISPRANVENGTYIGRNVTILPGVHIGSGVVVEDNCIVGKPSRVQMDVFRKRQNETQQALSHEDYENTIDTVTILEPGVYLQSGTVIYSGCTLRSGVVCEDNCVVRWDTIVGNNTKLMLGVVVGSYIEIGQYSRIGGLCGNYAKIGDYVTCFGALVHSYRKYGGGRPDPAPTLEDYVTVGYGCNIIGGIRIGARSYVAAGSIVSKDVPPDCIVTGKNIHRSFKEWTGPLKDEYLRSFPLDGSTRSSKT